MQQQLLAMECRVFGDNSAAEFHKLRHRILQNLPWKNGDQIIIQEDHSPETVKFPNSSQNSFHIEVTHVTHINSSFWQTYTTENLQQGDTYIAESRSPAVSYNQ